MLLRHLVSSLLSCVLSAYASVSSHERRNSTGLTNAVTWDSHSLSIQGQRVFILSAEFHPWRLPGNPDLWADIFQKIKSNGFNTVSFCISWATHFPTPNTNNSLGDFQEGTYRDIQRFIDEGKKAGLWMIARPGPYINAETTGGGLPGWVAWTPYMTAIAQIIARNQVSNGGPIILVQAENEYSASTNNNIYMQAIIDLYRANGIVVPITHNDQHAGANGNFSPDKPGTHVDIYCGDSYPQGANSWAQVQSVYYSNHLASAPTDPLCLAEVGGGFLLGWGSVARGGTGYEKYSNDLTDATYENVFYKDSYGQTVTMLNIYMVFGGTNWGQTLEPTVYTSYEYGGGISESRVANAKMNEMRLQGLFLRVSRDLLGSSLIANGTNYTTSSLIHTAELRNSITGASFYFMRHDTSTSTALTTSQLTINTSQGSKLVPQTGTITFNGREAKIIVTDYIFGASSSKILYSTAEIMTWTTIDNTDYIIIHAPPGQTGETAFVLSNPLVNLSDAPGASSKVVNGLLTLNYAVGGIQTVSIKDGETTLVVMIMDKSVANNWHAPIIAGSGNFGNFFSVGTNASVLVGGPYLVRTATITGNTLALTGDNNGTTLIQMIAPKAVTRVTWNDATIAVTRTPSQINILVSDLSGPQNLQALALPQLTNWKVSGSLPEISTSFDDSSFTACTLTATNYTNLPVLAGDRVLYSQQYGFYGGNLIFRGRFTATGKETAIVTTVQSGIAGGYSAWLNGIFLGSSQGSPTISVTTDTWNITSSMLRPGATNVFVILQDHMGLVETSTSSGKEPRGIRGFSIVGSNATFTSWTLQGNQGGAANTPDTFRGYLNEGGLFAERIGAHLPGFPDSNWVAGTPLTGGGVKGAGVNFYRTTFDLNIPDGIDMPVRLSITPSAITSNFRMQIYLNGWQIGKYINNIGRARPPQQYCGHDWSHWLTFRVRILRRKSTNTLALSLWSLDGNGASVAGIDIVSDGIFNTGFQFNDYVSPDYTEQQAKRPAATFVTPM
ncbi:hypothetical protein D9619_006705 [Psilocybe cf. subviscida]|uniref:Beta-galactosidase n=1 Tax=Psilocybe cf. subviscida TaxID=2480587 RepID=A0A8H5B4J2_9AGAR|nr:hypothetical protein D9619_006705 [Psilocybe cf. subviscida]